MKTTSDAKTLVLVRHGQSTANAEGIFTGMLDVALSERGRVEASTAAVMLNASGLRIDTVFSSTMRRALETTNIVIHRLTDSPTNRFSDWRLDERNYGDLTGMCKADVLATFGETQFLEWRRSVHAAPPPMSKATALKIGAGFADGSANLGLTESLSDVIFRVGECYRSRILPTLGAGSTVLVVAHGNSLRALCSIIDRLSDDAITELNIPTGQPLVYQLSAHQIPLVKGGQYLNPDEASAAAHALAHEGGT